MRVFVLPLFLFIFHSPANSQQLTSETSAGQQTRTDAPVKARAKIQIVFALDATGSMSGLIAAAKDKIWSIATSITQAEPAPELELGLIFYRDRLDDFITKRVALTDSIDKVYSELMAIRAQGGGDQTESVNQALYEAVTTFQWDPSTHVYKSIFLIGDAPPHMDYKNDVQYSESCLLAKSKDIIINTIQMGNDAQTESIWKQIAKCHEGGYVKADMKVNDIRITTPYDEEIAKINDSLENMNLYYGASHVKTEGNKLKQLGSNIKSLSASHIQAQRAEYKLNESVKKANSRVKTNDLIEDISNKVTELSRVKDEELPEEMKIMNEEERRQFVSLKIAEKAALRKRLAENIKLRSAYVDKELSKKNKNSVDNSFNNIVFENIRVQTQRKNIELKGRAKY